MFELNISASSTEDLQAKLLGLAALLGGNHVASAVAAATKAPAEPVEVEKPKAVKATPAKATPAKVQIAEPAKAKLLDFNTEVAPSVVAAVDSHGKEVVAAVLVEYGVTRASEIAPEQWPEFLASLSDAVEALA